MARRVAEEDRGEEEEEEPVTPTAAGGTQQATEDRRLLRSRYLAVKSHINDDKDEMASADSDKFTAVLTQADSLHKFVQKPREQVADAEALLEIATSLAAAVRSQSALGIRPSDLIAGLLRKFGTQAGADGEGASLRWGRVGRAASHVFMAVPGCSTMVGPMKVEVKARRKLTIRRRTPRPRKNDRPEQLADPSETAKSNTDMNMAVLFDVLRKNKKARLENLILNRTSFAQTVENIFALSFLVKDGRVEIDVNDDGHHIVCPRNAPAASSVTSGEVVYNHFVLRFDFKDWKIMKGIVAEGEELMLHWLSSLSTSGGNNHPEMPSRSTPGNQTPVTPANGMSGGNKEPEMPAHKTPWVLVTQARQDETICLDTPEVMVTQDKHTGPHETICLDTPEVMVTKDKHTSPAETICLDTPEVMVTKDKHTSPPETICLDTPEVMVTKDKHTSPPETICLDTPEVMVTQDKHSSPQDKLSVAGFEQVIVIDDEMVKDRQEVSQTCKRKRLFEEIDLLSWGRTGKRFYRPTSAGAGPMG